MNTIKAIRARLGATQSEIADALDVTQGNVSFYEKGQTLPPDVAAKLISFAADRGLAISFDHIYGREQLPELATPKPTKRKAEA